MGFEAFRVAIVPVGLSRFPILCFFRDEHHTDSVIVQLPLQAWSTSPSSWPRSSPLRFPPSSLFVTILIPHPTPTVTLTCKTRRIAVKSLCATEPPLLHSTSSYQFSSQSARQFTSLQRDTAMASTRASTSFSAHLRVSYAPGLPFVGIISLFVVVRVGPGALGLRTEHLLLASVWDVMSDQRAGNTWKIAWTKKIWRVGGACMGKAIGGMSVSSLKWRNSPRIQRSEVIRVNGV